MYELVQALTARCGNEHFYKEHDLSRPGCDPDGADNSGAREKCFDCSKCGAGAEATPWGCKSTNPQFDSGTSDSNDNGEAVQA